MGACTVQKLLQRQESLDLRSIVSFFNKHYPDVYISHLIENRGNHQYERIKLGPPGCRPDVVIHKPTEDDFAIVVSPRYDREFRSPHAEVHLGKKIEVLFFEALDSDGKTKYYIEFHDNSLIVRINPRYFIIFSADYCKECSKAQE